MSEDKEENGVTAAELARIFNVSRMTVARHVKSGSIIQVGESESGKKLYSQKQAGSFLKNSVLNNRKINSQKTITPNHGKVIDDGSLPEGTAFDDWLVDLFGDDFKSLDDQGKLARSRSVREARMAALADIDTRKARGELIERETIGRQIKMVSAAWCATMHTFPSRWSSDLVAMNDQHEIKQYIAEEINKLIDEVVDKLNKLEDPEER